MADYTKKRQKVVVGQIQTIGQTQTINSQTIRVMERDNAGLITKATGTAAASTQNSQSVYAKDAEYIKTDTSTGATGKYRNIGTTSSSSFSLIEGVEAVITGVTAGNGMTGDATEGTASLAVGAGRGIAVRANATDVGANIYNTIGSALTVGTLVNLSGYDTTLGITVTKADADAGVEATHVVLDEIANTTAGVVYPFGLAVNVNTVGRTIGDKVYADNTTAGGFIFAAPTGTDQMVQEVGVVKVVSATIGEIEFFPGSKKITKYCRTQIQADAIDGTKIADDAVDSEHIAGGAVDANLLEGLASGQFFIGIDGTAANNTKVVMSGDATMDNAGAVTIAGGAVEDSMLEGLASGQFFIGVDGTAANNTKVVMSGDATMTNGGVVSAKAGLKTDLVTVGLMGTVAEFGFPFNAETQTEQAPDYAKTYDHGTTSFSNVSTSNTSDQYAADWQLFPDTEVENDAVYFGGANPFGVMYFDIAAGTPATYGADSLSWEYWDGAVWSPLTIIYDYTDSTAQNGLRSFQRDGEIIFSAPANWASTTIDSQAAYWVRARCNATVNITQIPLLDSHEHYLISADSATEMPAAGTIGRSRVSFVTVSGANNDTKVILCNLTNGKCSAITTWTKALIVNEVANWSVACNAGDQIAIYVTQEDGTTEFANGIMEMNVVKS